MILFPQRIDKDIAEDDPVRLLDALVDNLMLDDDDDPGADLNGLYAECNGDICYNACKSVRVTSKSCVFMVQDSTIIVDMENIKINKRFIEYSKSIFKDLLVLDL